MSERLSPSSSPSPAPSEHQPHHNPLHPIRVPTHWEHKQARMVFGKPTHVDFHSTRDGLDFHWNSRRHRKGGMPVAKDPTRTIGGAGFWRTKSALPRIWGWDIGDISWWVAVLFLVGSIFWCVNGVLAFCYFSDTSKHIGLCEAVTAFMGGTLFLVGAYLSYVEALNPAQHTEFGWRLQSEFRLYVEQPRTKGHLGRGRRHFGRHAPASYDIEKGGRNSRGSSRVSVAAPSDDAVSTEKNQERPRWRWYGADWHSLGFDANVIQLYGASIFWLSVLCGLPGILPEAGAQAGSGYPAKTVGLWEGLYWTPQVIGAPGFVISGFMFMYEVQKKWYKPDVKSLGWHVGFWNTVGAWGFLFCGIFGLWRDVGGNYQQYGTAFSTFWGSWAFLIGSYIQLYETLNKR